MLPYIYVPVPQNKLVPEMDNHDLCSNFREALNVCVLHSLSKVIKNLMKGKINMNDGVNNYVLAVEIEQKASIMHYRADETMPFFKITFAIPGHVPSARCKLDDKLN